MVYTLATICTHLYCIIAIITVKLYYCTINRMTCTRHCSVVYTWSVTKWLDESEYTKVNNTVMYKTIINFIVLTLLIHMCMSYM